MNTRKNAKRITVGSYSAIRGFVQVFPNGGTIDIGDYCYIGYNTNIWSMSSIKIGDRVLISHGVNIIDSTSHSKVATERHKHYVRIINEGHPEEWSDLPGVKSKPIVIEDDVWISYGVSILPGVIIGKGSIIAANSTVTHDVPSNSIFRNQVIEIITPLK